MKRSLLASVFALALFAFAPNVSLHKGGPAVAYATAHAQDASGSEGEGSEGDNSDGSGTGDTGGDPSGAGGDPTGTDPSGGGDPTGTDPGSDPTDSDPQDADQSQAGNENSPADVSTSSNQSGHRNRGEHGGWKRDGEDGEHHDHHGRHHRDHDGHSNHPPKDEDCEPPVVEEPPVSTPQQESRATESIDSTCCPANYTLMNMGLGDMCIDYHRTRIITPRCDKRYP